MKTSSLNLFLILSGLTLLTIGTYRAYAPKINKAFLWTNIPPLIVLICLIILCIILGGKTYFFAGMDSSVMTTSAFLPTLVFLMPIIGISAPIVRHFQNEIGTAISGQFGYAWALISGFVIPGGNTASGVITHLWEDSPSSRAILLYFMTVSPLVSFTIYFIRCLGLGSEISKAMYQANWFVAIALMPCFMIYGKFFVKIPDTKKAQIAMVQPAQIPQAEENRGK